MRHTQRWINGLHWLWRPRCICIRNVHLVMDLLGARLFYWALSPDAHIRKREKREPIQANRKRTRKNDTNPGTCEDWDRPSGPIFPKSCQANRFRHLSRVRGSYYQKIRQSRRLVIRDLIRERQKVHKYVVNWNETVDRCRSDIDQIADDWFQSACKSLKKTDKSSTTFVDF